MFLLAGRFPGQTDAQALGRATDAVGWAEEAGFDDVWIAEHHFMSYGVCPSAITFAAHALARTSRITVGTAVAVLSTAHPVQLAEQARMLTVMSGGRFYLGVGRGGPWRDLEVFGTGLYRWERGSATACGCSWTPSPRTPWAARAGSRSGTSRWSQPPRRRR
ncbi:hypothetical protein GCM10029964_046180 [Kibdelosporangium lantanae]